MSRKQALLDLFSLDGQVAVVTGAASGIGKAIAALLASAGATVVVADKDLTGADNTAAMIGGGAFSVHLDLQDDDSVVELFRTVKSRTGQVDVLVNNAAIYPRFPLETVSRQQWEGMHQVNVWGCFVVLREAARIMRADGRGGRIINVSSIGAQRTAVFDQVAYNASKAALDAVTQSAALEFAPHGILVNSVLPGAVQPLEPKPKPADSQPPMGPLLAPGRILLQRAALADEVAAPILMLASAAGGYITGQLIVIDGGFSVS